MKLRFVYKTNHPMFGKNHTLESLSLISKPGELNPMFNKTHSAETKVPAFFQMEMKSPSRRRHLFPRNSGRVYP
jgi:hypothetical protein